VIKYTGLPATATEQPQQPFKLLFGGYNIVPHPHPLQPTCIVRIRYNRLYTVTAQCSEEELPRYRATLEKVVNSFATELKPLI
jgi:hypothetical protein